MQPARAKRRQGASPPSLTAEEARSAAAAEGLELVPGNTATGFKGVQRSGSASYIAVVSVGHQKTRTLGSYATAEEAALAYARHIGKEAAAKATAAATAVAESAVKTLDQARAEALAMADAEGLTLVKSPRPGRSASGFKCVHREGNSFFVKAVNHKYLGWFRTAEEAALCYARYLGKEAAAEAACKSANLTAEAARAAATAEGLVFVPGDTATGFKCVARHSSGSRPFQASVREHGRTNTLGHFATAEEAALSYARYLGKGAAAKAAAAYLQTGGRREALSAEGALAAAAAEGLALVPSKSATGFKNVSKHSSGSRPFEATVREHGRKKSLGYFATAEEAALSYARYLGKEAAAEAVRPSLTAEEARAAAAVEGLVLEPSDNTTGFKHVYWHGRSIKASLWVRTRGACVLRHLGAFPTAEEAALVVARHFQRVAENTLGPPLSAMQQRQQIKEQALKSWATLLNAMAKHKGDLIARTAKQTTGTSIAAEPSAVEGSSDESSDESDESSDESSDGKFAAGQSISEQHIHFSGRKRTRDGCILAKDVVAVDEEGSGSAVVARAAEAAATQAATDGASDWSDDVEDEDDDDDSLPTGRAETEYATPSTAAEEASTSAAQLEAHPAAAPRCLICLGDCEIDLLCQARAPGGWGYTACCSNIYHHACLSRWLNQNEEVEWTYEGKGQLNQGCPTCRNGAIPHSKSRMLGLPQT